MGTIKEGKPNSLAAASEDYQLFIEAQMRKILMSISNTNTNKNINENINTNENKNRDNSRV